MGLNLFGSDEAKPKSYYNRRAFFSLGLTVAFIVLKWGLGWIHGHGANYAYIILMAGAVTMDSIANENRYITRESVITDDRTFSYNPRSVWDVGIWNVIEVGGMNVSFWPAVGGGEGTIVVPSELVRKEGENLRIHGRPHHAKFEELPSEVRTKIKEENMDEPYRFTIVPTSMPIRNDEARKRIESLTSAESLLEDRQRRISELEELNQKKFKDLESAAETGKQIAGPSRFERFKEKVGGEDENRRR